MKETRENLILNQTKTKPNPQKRSIKFTYTLKLTQKYSQHANENTFGHYFYTTAPQSFLHYGSSCGDSELYSLNGL